MDEIREVESELRRLREDAVRYKTEAEKLKKEKKTTEARNEYLVNKLKEASYVYGEAGKRLLYFINNQVNPVTKRLNDLEGQNKKLKFFDKSLADSIAELEKSVKEDISKTDKRIASLSIDFRTDNEKLRRALKAAARKSQEVDARAEERLLAVKADVDAAIKKSSASQEKKTALRLSASQRKMETKIESLKEHTIILGKDIESLRKFEGDIQGLEGKLQTTVSNLTQTRIEMEKLTQTLKNQMAATKANITARMDALTENMDKKILSISSELHEADEKNMEDIQQDIEAMKRELAAFEKRTESLVRKGENSLNKEMKTFASGLEKRIASLEAGIAANSETAKDIQKTFNSKIEKLMKHDSSLDEKMNIAETRLMEQVDILRDMSARKETALKNELGKTRKILETNIEKAAMDADKKIGLMGKDVQNLLAVKGSLDDFAAESEKRKQEISALNAKIDSINASVQNKSEKDDMKLRNTMDAIEKDIKNRLDNVESSILRENVRSFTDVKKNLKNDIHALRKENAVLKTEVKNLQKLGAVVEDLQKQVVATKVMISSSVSDMDKLSSKVSSNIERETLKVSKDMAAISSNLKAELKDVIASEKERFASRESELDTKFSELSGTVSNMSSAVSSTSAKSDSNTKKLAVIEKKLTRLMNEIVGLKKEYKTEMGKLLKDLEE